MLARALLLPTAAAHAADSTDSRAAAFASKGYAEPIAACHLPRTCAGKRPRESRKDPVTETGNDNIVEEHLVRFDGLEISFLFVFGNAAEPRPTDWKKGGRYPPPYVTHLKITSADWPVRQGLRVGTRRAVVEKALGRLAPGDDGCARLVDESAMGEAALCFANERLRSIEWTPWWDG